MRAMVLAAGLGMRMRPLTEQLAKPALPVLNRPLIHWTLALLARHGVDEVVVNLHHLPQTVRAAVGDGSAFGLRVRYSHEAEILGTGGGPRKARRWLGDDPILLVNGDVLMDLDLSAMVAHHRARGALVTLGLRPNPNPRRYLAVRMDARGAVVDLPGVRRRRRGRPWLFTGVHVIEPRLLERLSADRPSDSIRDLYAPLVDAGAAVCGLPLSGLWMDMGTPELYRQGQLLALARGFAGFRRRARLLASDARISSAASVRHSVVGPGAHVESGALVEESIVGAGARVGRGARVRQSVLAAGADVPAGGDVAKRVVMGPGPRSS